jgi:F0F1-type ATP synthase membrane subunit b/b'
MLFLWLLLIQLVIFGGLLLFLRTILSRNISKATAHLDELNLDYTSKLEEAKKKLEDADKYYDEALLKAKIDAEKTRIQIMNEAHGVQETIVADSRKQSEDIIAQAQRARDLVLEEVDKNIEERAVQRACELVQSILPGEIHKDMHEHWVNEMFKHGLDALDRLNLPEDLSEAVVVTADPLTHDQKEHLIKKIRQKIGREIRLSESVDPILIVGFKVTLGTVVIDGSMRLKIVEAMKNARHSK